jgi:hypothetical protein
MMRPLGSGIAAAPIVAASYGDGRPPQLVGEGGVATVLLADVSFWTIRDIDVTNNGREEGKRTGILLEATESGETVRADIDSFHTIIEDNWSHDNQGGLFSLCNSPSDDSNVTDGTVVRFNVSENDGIRAFGFSGRVTHTIIYNNTVLIGPGHKEAIVEARPFSKSKPRFADGAAFFNNAVIILGEASYDFAEATHMQFDSNCFVGTVVRNPLPETGAVTIPSDILPNIAPADAWHALSAYRAAAKACGSSSHREPETIDRDITSAKLRGIPFRGAVQP